MTRDPSPAQVSSLRRWPVGLATLAGLVIGVVAGVLVGSLPVGTAAGVGLGVGVDSAIHYLTERR
jgi:hypothetical protein